MPDIDIAAISLYINTSKNDLQRRALLQRQ